MTGTGRKKVYWRDGASDRISMKEEEEKLNEKKKEGMEING